MGDTDIDERQAIKKESSTSAAEKQIRPEEKKRPNPRLPTGNEYGPHNLRRSDRLKKIA